MAFDLRRLTNAGLTGRGSQLWSYRTDDSLATVAGANYFLTAWPKLRVGDVIFVSVVSGIDSGSEVYVADGGVVVKTVSRFGVTVDPTVGSGLGGSTNTVNLDPIYSPQHTSYQIGVYDGPKDNLGQPGSNVDEKLFIGYNINGLITSEAGMGLTQEIDWLTTARGSLYQRTMEAYWHFSGPATPANQFRALFFSFEPGDTSTLGDGSKSGSGELLYGYLSVGYNRADHAPNVSWGGGGFTIYRDGNSSGVIGTTALATFDTDGCKLNYLRCSTNILLISGVSGAVPNVVLTVGSGHAINPGAIVQIFKPYLSGWCAAWSGGTSGARYEDGVIVTGRVTATTSTSLTTTIDNTSLGIVGGAGGTGYGVHLAIPNVGLGAVPVFQYLKVGTSAINSTAFSGMEVAGDVGIVGSMGLFHPSYMATAAANSSAIAHGMFEFLTTPSVSGKHQCISGYTATSLGWSIGFINDTSGNNFDDYYFGIGPARSDDTTFTVANASLAIFHLNASTSGYIGIGGAYDAGNSRMWANAWLNIGASTAAGGLPNNGVAHLFLEAGAAPSTPANGMLWYDGTDVYLRQGGVTRTMVGTGNTTGTRTVNPAANWGSNKPGANNRTDPATWVKYISGGTTYWIPAWQD